MHRLSGLAAIVAAVAVFLPAPAAGAAGKLLLTEIVVTPKEAEFIEIHNPNDVAVALEQYHLCDYPDYYLLTASGGATGTTDFRVRFPEGSSIAAGAYLVVALHTATDYFGTYGSYPDYDLSAADANAPAMEAALSGDIGADAGLSNASESVVLFRWDGSSDLVEDVDYFCWGSSTSYFVDKTGETVGAGTYLSDTAVASQVPGPAPAVGQSVARVVYSEGTQTASGGNGITGADETSEYFPVTWVIATTRTPGEAETREVTGSVTLLDDADESLVTIAVDAFTVVRTSTPFDIDYTVLSVPVDRTGVAVTTGEAGFEVIGSPARIVWADAGGDACGAVVRRAIPPPDDSDEAHCGAGVDAPWLAAFALACGLLARRARRARRREGS
jgi:hypothetical protein